MHIAINNLTNQLVSDIFLTSELSNSLPDGKQDFKLMIKTFSNKQTSRPEFCQDKSYRLIFERSTEPAVIPDTILELGIAVNIVKSTFLGLPVKRFGLAPYSLAIRQPVDSEALDLN